MEDDHNFNLPQADLILAQRSPRLFWYILIIGPSVLRAPAEQTKVATILGTFFHFSFLFLGLPLFKTTEGVVVGFQIFAWAPK